MRAADRGAPPACRICANREGNRLHIVREMMFGLGDRFEYVECGRCGCLQIAELPDDLGRYYPSGYYSFAPAEPPGRNVLVRLLRGARNRSAISGRGMAGRLLDAIKPAHVLRSLRPLRLRPSSRILDVGSGSGALVKELHLTGFRNVLGIDPYLAEGPEAPADPDGAGDRGAGHGTGIRILRCSLDEVEPGWDVIMFHHSFEHVPDPLDTLRTCARLLSPGGRCLIRMPNARCEAWRRYGVNWVQLDAPRHLHVHTPESLRIVAARAGLEVERTTWDSDEFQFWGSEQYLRDLPLRSPDSYAASPAGSIFNRDDIRGFRREARRLNAAGLGDQAAFYLRRAGGS